MSSFISKNPFTQETLQVFESISVDEAHLEIDRAQKLFEFWKQTSLDSRIDKLKNFHKIINENEQKYARMISLEMGKPITQSLQEVRKCLKLVDFLLNDGKQALDPYLVSIDGVNQGVRYDPLGLILGVMPWNYPFWQVFRYALPAIIAGNVCLLKHAPNVPQCGQLLEDIFEEAFGERVLINLFLEIKDLPSIVSRHEIRAGALTGSRAAGASYASLLGENVKPTVLELGSNDPFIILKDANIEEACDVFIDARFTNCGQTCIAAKRLIVEAEVAEDVRDRIIDKIKHLKIQDPLNDDTYFSCMAREDLADTLAKQWEASIGDNVNIHFPFKQIGAHVEAAFLENPDLNSPAWTEELFGPVAVMKVAKDTSHCLSLANDTKYGLGASVWTSDKALAKEFITQLNFGTVAVNQKVSSNPIWPFGGIKDSGYGRELGIEGIRSFTNKKTYYGI